MSHFMHKATVLRMLREARTDETVRALQSVCRMLDIDNPSIYMATPPSLGVGSVNQMRPDASEHPACGGSVGEAVAAQLGDVDQCAPAPHDPVNFPKHYRSHPSGVECIQITEHMNFNLGNAVKYIWRADEKGSTLEDLQKARWYLDREIQRRQGGVQPTLV